MKKINSKIKRKLRNRKRLKSVNSNRFRNLNLGNPILIEKLYKNDSFEKKQNNADNWFRVFTSAILMEN